ncbi:GAF domain-containing protein [Flavobacterium sp. RHBU_3]|uniref:GAF domain-containing protein n=1 Tax=Flavobacterium sp. RHBU_3 TaxID=3391184 RepID=UPI0039846F3E
MSVKYHGLSEEYDDKRIKELRKYGILDTLPEQAYDDMTRLAAIICNAPIAIISLVDKDRQWFKSIKGLDAEETHRQHSFCSHAIVTPDQPFIVEDSRLDDRFKDNPLVTGAPNIVFYAGIPLKSENGYGLGSFCIIDTVPRHLSDEQIEALQILARQVMLLLEMRKKTAELDIKTEMLGMKLKKFDETVAQKVTEAMNKKK